MKPLKNYLLMLTLFAASVAAHAQNADEIIAKHIDAIGGREKLSGVTSVKMNSTNVVMGNEAPSTITIVNGKGFRSEVEMMGSKMIQVFTDKSGWMVNPMMGSADPTPLPEEQVKIGKDQIYTVPLLNYAANGQKAEYVGQEKVGSVNAYKVKLTGKDGDATTYYFDPATYYLVQLTKSGEVMGQKLDIVSSFSDFKKTDYGWVVPQTTEINMGGQFSITSKLKNIEVNPAVDAAIFEMKK